VISEIQKVRGVDYVDVDAFGAVAEKIPDTAQDGTPIRRPLTRPKLSPRYSSSSIRIRCSRSSGHARPRIVCRRTSMRGPSDPTPASSALRNWSSLRRLFPTPSFSIKSYEQHLATDPTRLDRLYSLLPAVHRMRDADQGYPLKALLRVIAEQVNVVEDDIAGLYENWFIETAEDWAVPYIGDLVGYRPVADGGLPPDSTACDSSPVLVPRREIANLIRYRRRKGTLALLELLANDVAGWPARAVEFFKLLCRNQNIDHLFMHRHGVADLRQMDALDRLSGPFDSIAHTVDARRIGSNRTRGRFNIPCVGITCGACRAMR